MWSEAQNTWPSQWSIWGWSTLPKLETRGNVASQFQCHSVYYRNDICTHNLLRSWDDHISEYDSWWNCPWMTLKCQLLTTRYPSQSYRRSLSTRCLTNLVQQFSRARWSPINLFILVTFWQFGVDKAHPTTISPYQSVLLYKRQPWS